MKFGIDDRSNHVERCMTSMCDLQGERQDTQYCFTGFLDLDPSGYAYRVVLVARGTRAAGFPAGKNRSCRIFYILLMQLTESACLLRCL